MIQRTAVDIVVEQLKRHEGFSAEPYLDSKGILTIGYGTNLEALRIDEMIGLVLMRRTMNSSIEDARILFPSFLCLSMLRQAVLINMAYNMGRDSLRGFIRFRKAVAAKAWTDAAYEMIDSKWAREDVGHRAVELASIMEHNKPYRRTTS